MTPPFKDRAGRSRRIEAEIRRLHADGLTWAEMEPHLRMTRAAIGERARSMGLRCVVGPGYRAQLAVRKDAERIARVKADVNRAIAEGDEEFGAAAHERLLDLEHRQRVRALCMKAEKC